MVVPHVINPTNLPSGFVETTHYTEVKEIPIDPTGWNTITDAMSRVLLPEGTAPQRMLRESISPARPGRRRLFFPLALRAGEANQNEEFAQNGWFVGFTPGGIPTSSWCCCLKAASTAGNWRRSWRPRSSRPTWINGGDSLREDGGSRIGQVEVGSLWTDPGGADEDGVDADENRARRPLPG